MKMTGDWNFGIYKVTHERGEGSDQTFTEEIICTESESLQESNFVLEFKISINAYIEEGNRLH